MIIRNAHDVQPLKVHDLNEIIVLVDRSETAFTEVGLNTWPSGIKGPPHAHSGKEQIFLVLSGKGRVLAGDANFRAEPGDVVYVPPGVEHQTLVDHGQPLVYFLFNAFLDATKEGHESYAEHIAIVKDTRKAQAEGQASSGAAPRSDKSPARGNLEEREVPDLGASLTTVVLGRSLTVRSEMISVISPPHTQDAVEGDLNREQILYILEGQGTLTIGDEARPKSIAQGDAVYIPAKTAYAVKTAESQLHYAKFYTDCVAGAAR